MTPPSPHHAAVRDRARVPPEAAVQRAIVSLLRGEAPAGRFDPDAVAGCLARYECGAYLHASWSRNGKAGALPEAWAEALESAHRAARIDSLAALAEFRAVGAILAAANVPFILLKGAAYLVDLYPDPAARALTDIDLLVRPADAGRAARGLRRAGYLGAVGPQYPEDRRFEMRRPGEGRHGFEIHWRLGLPLRLRIDQEGLWRRAVPCALEEVVCLRLSHEDALLYHVGHLADHYFGPTLKWVLDLREMFRRWDLAEETLVERARSWRVRVALHVALRHLEKIVPGASPRALAARLAPGRLRERLLRRYLSGEPAEIVDIDRDGNARYPLRSLILDRPIDAALLAVRVLARPAARALQSRRPPWEWPG